MTLQSLAKKFFRWLFNLDTDKGIYQEMAFWEAARYGIGISLMVFVAMCYLGYLLGPLYMLIVALVALVAIQWTHTKRSVGIIYWLYFSWRLLSWFGAYGSLEPNPPTLFQPVLMIIVALLYFGCIMIYNWIRRLINERDWENSFY